MFSNKEEQVFSTQWFGRELTFKTGSLAKQADATVLAQYGETVIMATVVESASERDLDFFPLQVEFEERFYAAGIIKGSQWIKREARPSEAAVLAGRMIDRSIRPLFDDSSRKDIQVILTTLSVDGENGHDLVGLIAASAALAISGVKWDGPIAGIKVGLINNEFVFNPTLAQIKESELDLLVAGTEQKSIMIEAAANEVPEDKVYEAIVQGQKEMQTAISLIKELQSKVAPREKREKEKLVTEEQLAAKKEKEEVVNIAKQWLAENVNKTLFDKQYYTKGERKMAVSLIKEGLDKFLFAKSISDENRSYAIKTTVEPTIDAEITRELIENERRVDGRKLDEIRELNSAVRLFPRTHGNGLFSRGETQTLSVVTLASAGLEQTIEDLEGTSKKRYLHHYNFAPFSVGETKPMRGPGRREIGHGALAEKALLPVIPSKEDFPYTIRVVSETLGSNGSSSMGATCGSTLALMDAGVPIKRPVAGVAIGLASNDDMSKWKVVTDIQDLEDGKGGMDFKVTGTEQGVTAIQLDTKTNGLVKEIIKEALEKGKVGRMQILAKIKEAITEPRQELSPYAPKITSFYINPDKIREVIGSGGKIINKLIEDYEVSIDLEDDGLVMVAGVDQEKTQAAIEAIKNIVREFEAGEVFTGKVVKMMDFGAFITLTPGNDGLVHVSEMAPYRVGNPGDFLSEGDTVTVKIKEIDDRGRLSLTMKGQAENEHLWKDKKGEQKNNGFAKPKFNNDNTQGHSKWKK